MVDSPEFDLPEITAKLIKFEPLSEIPVHDTPTITQKYVNKYVVPDGDQVNEIIVQEPDDSVPEKKYFIKALSSIKSPSKTIVTDIKVTDRTENATAAELASPKPDQSEAKFILL